MLHLAELVAGVPYRVPKHCTVLQDGRRVRIGYGENDHCCERFALAGEWLRARGLQSEGRVGEPPALLARGGEIVSRSRASIWRAIRWCFPIRAVPDVPNATWPAAARSLSDMFRALL